jgi:nitric-oxide synthase, brain
LRITADGSEDERFGVCSNYLEGLERNDEIQIFVRSAPGFHLPKDTTQPIILIGPGEFRQNSNSILTFFFDMRMISSSIGTGTAPFRSFWQELDEIKSQNVSFCVPKVWLFFGCRAKCLDLYSDEKREMLEKGILDKVFLALSREVKTPKVS